MMTSTTNMAASKSRIAYCLHDREMRMECGFGTGKSSAAALLVRHVYTAQQIRTAVHESGGRGLWIASRGRMVAEFIKAVTPALRRFESLLVLDHLSEATWLAAADLFHNVAATNRPESFLPSDELSEVLVASNREDLFIGGSVDQESEVIVLIRGDLSKLVVPMSTFRTTEDGSRPDFDRFSVIDHGHTLKFGDYEASADAVLYEADPHYRRQLAAKRRDAEKGFGPALRRLRKQKRLKRSEFALLNEKTIARIERREVDTPQGNTLKIIAGKLGVPAEEIGSH